ncbi:MAG: PEP/pyruvate-binding domain-containing protein [archaeon]
MMKGEVGTKALNIAELHNRSYPVPKGFVIKSRALSDFLLKNKLVEPINNILENIDINSYINLVDASKKINDLVMAGNIPETLSDEISATYKGLSVSDDMKGLNEIAKSMINAGRGDLCVAVRCSAITEQAKLSASGIHSSTLNILGTPSLMKSILASFASFYSPAAIYYYKKNNVRSPELAIIVQEMIVSEKSGVLFTANPLTNNLNEFVIEGSYGLGQTISSGEVAPDRYTLNVHNGTITEAKVNKKAAMVVIDQLNGGTRKERVTTEQVNSSILSTNELKVIAEIGDKIQVHFNHPQDIEWAIAKRRVYILQSIPISTISLKREQIPRPDESSIALCKGAGANISSAEGAIKVINSTYELGNITGNTILVAPTASIDLVPVLRTVKGIITNNGGMLCNLAKISREMNIPLIVGAYDATMKLANTRCVTMDCATGSIYEKKDTIPPGPERPASIPSHESSEEQEPIIATKIKLNIYAESDCDSMKDISDGVGFMPLNAMSSAAASDSMNGLANPAQSAPVSNIALKVIDSFYPKTVWIKTKNPSDPDFRNQLMELKLIIDKGYNNIGIIFPGIHHHSYMTKIKKIAEEVGLNLSSVEYGLAIDTPAACILSDDFSDTGIKFISIDYELLIQSTLGLAPGTLITNHEMHPAVLKIIRNCIKSYHNRKIHTSIHGKGITNQQFIEKLIEFNIDSISVNRSEFRMLKYVAARTEKKMLLDIMMHKSYRPDSH